MAATRGGGLRRLGIRYVIALVVTSLLTAGAVAAVNFGIDSQLGGVRRVMLAVAVSPARGANFLLIGSDSRAFVSSPQEAQAFGDRVSQGGQRSDTLMVAHVEP